MCTQQYIYWTWNDKLLKRILILIYVYVIREVKVKYNVTNEIMNSC